MKKKLSVECTFSATVCTASLALDLDRCILVSLILIGGLHGTGKPWKEADPLPCSEHLYYWITLTDFYKIPILVGTSVCGFDCYYNSVEVVSYQSGASIRVHALYPYSYFADKNKLEFISCWGHMLLHWDVSTYWVTAFLDYLFRDIPMPSAAWYP